MKEVKSLEQIIWNIINGIKLKFTVESIVQISVVVVLMVGAYIALFIVQKKLKAKFALSGDIKKTHNYAVVFRTIRIVVGAMGAVAILQAIGINLAGLTVAFGVVVIVLVLAVKDALQDVFAGAVLMADKYFAVGDAVEYEGRDGIVVGFTVRTTKIELLDDRSVLSVANRNITRIRKLNHLVDIDLPLPYELTRAEAYAVLSEICESIRAIDGIESCELKGTQDFGASAMIYKIRFFCEPHDRPDIRRAALRAVQDGLEHNGVHVPYQQIDVHEKN